MPCCHKTVHGPVWYICPGSYCSITKVLLEGRLPGTGVPVQSSPLQAVSSPSTGQRWQGSSIIRQLAQLCLHQRTGFAGHIVFSSLAHTWNLILTVNSQKSSTLRQVTHFIGIRLHSGRMIASLAPHASKMRLGCCYVQFWLPRMPGLLTMATTVLPARTKEFSKMG